MRASKRRKLYRTASDIVILLLIIELTYINAKSLLYLVAEFHLIDKVFAVLGAVAFSSATVLILRTDGRGWKRIVFPMMDSLLVFSGFNVRFVGHLMDNWLAFALSIFFAVFTALILYSLGQKTEKR